MITSCIEWDVRESTSQATSRKHLNDIVKAICKCGVAFSVWEKPNGDRKSSGHYDWSSMVGCDKKKVLKLLPDKLDGLLPPNSCETVINLWKV